MEKSKTKKTNKRKSSQNNTTSRKEPKPKNKNDTGLNKEDDIEEIDLQDEFENQSEKTGEKEQNIDDAMGNSRDTGNDRKENENIDKPTKNYN